MHNLCRSVSHLLLGHTLPSPSSNAFFQVEWPCDTNGTREKQWLPEGRSHIGEAGGNFSVPLEGGWSSRELEREMYHVILGVTTANMKPLSKESRAGSSRQHLSSKLGPSWAWNRAEQKLTQTLKDAGATDSGQPGVCGHPLPQDQQLDCWVKTLFWIELAGLSQSSLWAFWAQVTLHFEANQGLGFRDVPVRISAYINRGFLRARLLKSSTLAIKGAHSCFNFNRHCNFIFDIITSTPSNNHLEKLLCVTLFPPTTLWNTYQLRVG